ncbi:MAG: DUF429 domain-containing protein [Balneolaceae bacterium]
MKTAGVVGCSAGWFYVTLDEGSEHFERVEGDTGLKEIADRFDRIFLAIPTGLEESSAERECDRLLRELLGDNGKEIVISPPIRTVLHAPTFAEANFEFLEATGETLSPKTWSIVPKVKFVDKLLGGSNGMADKVYESHPELIYFKLNGGRIFQSKLIRKGLRHRLELLKNRKLVIADFFRDAKEEYRRNEVEETEILDAAALAWAATRSLESPLQWLPEEPDEDHRGVKKGICFV